MLTVKLKSIPNKLGQACDNIVDYACESSRNRLEDNRLVTKHIYVKL